MMDQENALLSLAPGLPIKSVGPSRVPGVGCSLKGSGHNSGAGSPMSIGSPAGVGMGFALKLRARMLTSTQFEDEEATSSENEEDDMDATIESAQDAQQ